MTWNQFVQNVATTFSQDFGVSSFFSSPSKAADWVQTHVIDPNPRLNPTQKGILSFWSEEAEDFANQEVGSNWDVSSRDGAYIYWSLMRDYVTYHSYDQRLFDLFDVGVDAAYSTTIEGQKENIIAGPLKIPWWVILIPILYFFRRK